MIASSRILFVSLGATALIGALFSAGGAALAPAASSAITRAATAVALLNARGGSIAVSTTLGDGAMIGYASNDAGGGVTLSLTDSGPRNTSGTPTVRTVVLTPSYEFRLTAGTGTVDFDDVARLAVVRSRSLLTGVNYVGWMSVGGRSIGSAFSAGRASHGFAEVSLAVVQCLTASRRPSQPRVCCLETRTSKPGYDCC
jgi:hypothetical protein